MIREILKANTHEPYHLTAREVVILMELKSELLKELKIWIPYEGRKDLDKKLEAEIQSLCRHETCDVVGGNPKPGAGFYCCHCYAQVSREHWESLPKMELG